MKRSVILILACLFAFPFIARSQFETEGIKKAETAPTPVEKPPKQPKNKQDIALIQEQGTTGGATNISNNPYISSGMFLEPGWMPGRVIIDDRNTLDIVMLRYDIYHQQMQFIRGKDTLAFSKPEEIKCFELEGKRFIYIDFESNGKIGKSYFEVLYDGNCKLLLHRTVQYHQYSESPLSQPSDLYNREYEYYISKKDDVARPVRPSTKSVLNVFNDKEEEIRYFINDNNLKMNNSDHLKQVVAYYNSLP
jgi:hypothetical protein